jgi:RNA polymerase sigma-70 factor (ECF subfamily)
MAQTQMLSAHLVEARARFLELVADLRPALHRYCARVVGSSIDGEDVVQDTLAKAFYALGMADEVPPLRPWLFRIAHNNAIDFLRRHERRHVELRAEPDEGVTEDVPEPGDPQTVREALSTFSALPVNQRCALILKDVLGHSLEETADTMGVSLPAVKSALVRGRAALRRLARPAEVDAAARDPVDAETRRRMERYASLFNARDWDALRTLLADEVRLDLVSRAERHGRAVGEYFSRYAEAPPVRLALGLADGRPVLLVYARPEDAAPSYFMVLAWQGDRVVAIRDFRYVPYIARDAAIAPAETG